jgi:hypothetical protein
MARATSLREGYARVTRVRRKERACCHWPKSHKPQRPAVTGSKPAGSCLRLGGFVVNRGAALTAQAYLENARLCNPLRRIGGVAIRLVRQKTEIYQRPSSCGCALPIQLPNSLPRCLVRRGPRFPAQASGRGLPDREYPHLVVPLGKIGVLRS